MIRMSMLSFLVLVASVVGSVSAEEGKADEPVTPSHRVVVYYLHNTWRCPGCNSVAALSRAAVLGGKGENSKMGTSIEATTPFAEEVKSGLVSFEAVNIDKKENKKLLKKLGNNLKVPIVAEIEDDKIVSFAPLTKAWKHLGNNKAFVKYVQDGATPVVAKVKPTEDEGTKKEDGKD